ncbi:hypothetical protein RQ479_18855 [Mesorhizobium sp. ISC25]|uniref:hypothetical protein n=1 Tax=Mesorhizobium sp. ISC25 TaxID=3077335 RepID=UPI0035D9B829
MCNAAWRDLWKRSRAPTEELDATASVAGGDNERATRLSGVRYWQVITALYAISSLLADTALHRPDQGAVARRWCCLRRQPRDRRHLDLRRPRRLHRHIIGALILTVLTMLLIILQMPEGVRRILFGLIVLFVTAAYLRMEERRSAFGGEFDRKRSRSAHKNPCLLYNIVRFYPNTEADG